MILHKEIEKLKQQLLALSALVEQRLNDAVRAVQERDAGLAARIIDTDTEIDNREVDLEEESLKVLALHQPVATDLRLIICVLKTNSDLERIGDLAVDIAERAKHLAAHPAIDEPFECQKMAQRVQAMLRKSLDAFVHLDAEIAQQVCADDDAVDEIHSAMYANIRTAMQTTPERVEILLSYLSVSRYLERIADHATNIAEDVLYLIEGNIVRHSGDIY